MGAKQRRAIMILGSSMFDRPAYIALKKMGLALIMTDINPSCPQFQYADEYFVANASETEEILRCFESSRYRHGILMAYCGNDFGVKSALAVNSAISGIKAIDTDAVDLNDKAWMKAVFEAAEICVPRAVYYYASEDVLSVIDDVEKSMDYPVVVKPTSGSGARGVSVCRHSGDFSNCWRTAIAEGDRVSVEKYIDGSHLDLNGFMVNGVFYRSGSSDRFFLPEPRRIMLKNYAPSVLSEHKLEKAWASLESAAKAQGLRFGPIKADFIVDSTGMPYLLETAIRFHGGLTTCGSMRVSGESFSIPEMVCVVDSELKKEFEQIWSVSRRVGSVHIFPTLPDTKVCGFNVPQQIEGVEDIFMRKVSGKSDSKASMNDNRDIPGYIVAFGETREQCDYHVAKALLKIEVKSC